MNEKIIKVLIDSIDLNGLSAGILDELLQPALQKIVDDSSNPFDNAAMAMLFPLLDAELKKLVAKAVEDLKQPKA